MTEVEQILKQVESLSPEDRLLLLSHLHAANSPAGKQRRMWREIAGTATELMRDADAQDWVSENRRIANRERSSEVVR